MKLRFGSLFTLFFCLTIGTALAQSNTFGIKFGPTVSYMKGLDSSPRIASHIGGVVSIELTEKTFLQPEVIYSLEGFRKDDMKVNLNYLVFPLVGKFYVNDAIYIQGGAQTAVLIRGRGKIQNESDNIIGQHNVMNIGLNGGIGYLTGHLSVDARYIHGLSKLNITGDEEKSYRSGVVQCSLGWFF